MSKIPIAVQLYTLREDTAKDFAGTIKKVADIGYSGVELAGHGGLPVRELAALLQDNNLSIAGSHIGLDQLEADIAKVIDENLSLGNTNIVVPYLGADRRENAEAYKKVAASLNEFGQTLNSYGLTLLYHNHDFEFQPLDTGEIGEEILLDNTDPHYVKAEVDTYWVLKAGYSPVEFIQKYKTRVPLLHIKDRNPEDGSFAEVGTGDLPLDAIVATAGEIGVSWLIVEQDVCKRPALESVTISYNNLKAKGYA